LEERATAQADITDTFIDATGRYVIVYITSLAAPGTIVHEMLSHFTNELRSIAGNALNSTNDHNSVLREILEMCYKQAHCYSGTLQSDDYFIQLGESSPEWPYDPDFESEEYYEHDDRIVIEIGYAEAFRKQMEHKSEQERQERQHKKQEWIRFWVQMLSRCPDGPTLFYPPASLLPHCQFAEIPRYLFRTFDDESSGRSDNCVVASADSISQNSGRSRVDLLSRAAEESTHMLYGHLT
jgi:hypothetical protein